MENQHRYHACPPQEFANSAQRIHKTDEVIKVRSGRQRVQKSTERVVHLMRIDTVSSGCKFFYPKGKGHAFAKVKSSWRER